MSNQIGQATNKLGELFVDIGVGGVGQTLKALNSVSATFLLTKNAATQAVKPFIDMGKQAASGAVDIAKMGASLGSTRIEAQKLIWYLRKNNLSEALTGDLGSLSQTFTRIKKGYGGIDGQMAMSMNALGLDWQKYDGSINSVFQYVKDVQNAIKKQNLDAATTKMHLANLGLGNAAWFYALQKGDFDLSKSKAYDDKVAKALIEAQEKENQRKLQGEINAALATSKVLNAGGAKIQDAINKVYEDVGTVLGDDEKAKTEVTQRYKGYAKTGAKISNPANNLLFGFELFKEMGRRKNNPAEELEAIGGNELSASSIQDAALPALPNVDNKTTVILNNHISGNAQFDELSVQEENALTGGREIEVNQYTVHNTAGL